MPIIKYQCPKCGRKFTEWGAEKVGLRCPNDEWSSKEKPCTEELVRVGSPDATPLEKPTLHRTKPRPVVPVVAPVPVEAETSAPLEEDLVSHGDEIEDVSAVAPLPEEDGAAQDSEEVTETVPLVEEDTVIDGAAGRLHDEAGEDGWH